MIQEETEEPVIFGKFGTQIDNFVYRQEDDSPMVLSDFTSDKKEVIAYGASMLVGGVAGIPPHHPRTSISDFVSRKR
jgi:hypothetical protein